MQLEFREIPAHPDLKLGIRFADWDRVAVNGNSLGIFIWVSSKKGLPNCQEILLRDGDHCISRLSTFQQTKSVLASLCPENAESSIFTQVCINRLILRKEGSISVLVTDEFSQRHHLGTIDFCENTFNDFEKPSIEFDIRPILISSLGRSGSTILTNCIGLHPEVCLIGDYPFEYRFFSYCLHATYIVTSPANHDCSMGPDSFEKVNVFNTGFNPFNNRDFDRRLDKNDLRDFYEIEFAHDTADFFMRKAKTAIKKVASAKKTATAFVEKAAGTNLSNLAENIFPQSKEIILIRNFWDMALSMIAFDNKRGTKSFYVENPDEWLIARAFQHCNLTIRSRIQGKILVKYEDLINDPELCLSNLAGKLGLRQDSEAIALMLEPFNNSTYLEKHKTSQRKKSDIKKWFSKDAITAAELLLQQCDLNSENPKYELATWIGDFNDHKVTENRQKSAITASDTSKVSWVEAFAWATDLNAAISNQNKSKLKRQKETIARLSHQSRLDSENRTKQIQSLSEHLRLVVQRAERAEIYAKSLEAERVRLYDYINKREEVFKEIDTHYKTEFEKLKRNSEKNTIIRLDPEEQTKIYLDSIKLERNDHISSTDNSEFEASDSTIKDLIRFHINRANLAEEYAKSLEADRKRIQDSFTNEFNLRQKNQELYSKELNDLLDRASRAEEYCKLLELEINKREKNLPNSHAPILQENFEPSQEMQNNSFNQLLPTLLSIGENMNQDEALRLVQSHTHWHHKFEIFPNIVTPGTYDPGFLLDKLGLPSDLTGKSILDIGACDGYFSAELYARGANITALDYRPKTESGFGIMEKVKGISIPHVVSNVYDINSNLGEFDIVLFLGVIYHLPDIVSALWKIRKICKGTIFVESYVENFGVDQPMARYYEASTLYGDSTNFWAPNIACMEAVLRDCGFTIQKTHQWGDRAMIEAKANGSDEKIKMAYGTFNSTTT